MQPDGNLVLYGQGGIWHTFTYGSPGAKLKVQNDGNARHLQRQRTVDLADVRVLPLNPEEATTLAPPLRRRQCSRELAVTGR